MPPTGGRLESRSARGADEEGTRDSFGTPRRDPEPRGTVLDRTGRLQCRLVGVGSSATSRRDYPSYGPTSDGYRYPSSGWYPSSGYGGGLYLNTPMGGLIRIR